MDKTLFLFLERLIDGAEHQEARTPRLAQHKPYPLSWQCFLKLGAVLQNICLPTEWSLSLAQT